MDLGARRIASLAGVVLALQCLVGIARAEGLESGLRVEYDPPKLSVNAREVSLGAVLRAIGAKVGFSVVETAPASKLVTLSIRNASLACKPLCPMCKEPRPAPGRCRHCRWRAYKLA